MSTPTKKRHGNKQILTKEFIYKIVLLEVVGFSLILPAQSSTGETTFSGCNTPSSVAQCGSGVCTVSFGALAPATYCGSTITFPTPFATIPKFASAQLAGINTTVNHQDHEIPIGEVYFQSDAGETWTNMPTTQNNEIYGTQVHETQMPATLPLALGSVKAILADFSALCINPSINGTAFIRPQYQDLAFDGKWKELASTHTLFDLNIGLNGNCAGSGPSGLGGPPTTLDAAVNSGLATNFTINDPLRIIGSFGNGVGDTPELNNIFLSIFTETVLTPALCISIVKLCYGGTILISKTSMQVMCVVQYTPMSGYECNFKWEAIE